MRFLLSVLVFIVGLSAIANTARQQCLSEMQKSVVALKKSIDKNYRDLGDTNGLNLDVAPVLLTDATGDNPRAVLIVHGFSGTPNEIKSLGEKMSSEGHTVFMPLLEDYGGTAALANQGEATAWKNSVRIGLEMLAKCYQDVALVGFSLGGSIVTDLALDSAYINDEGVLLGTTTKISSVTLLAPYYQAYSTWLDLLKWKPAFILNSISIPLLYSVSHHPDLRVMVEHPTTYNQHLPLEAAGRVLDYGESVGQTAASIKSKVPTLLMASGSDQTVDLKAAKDFVSQHFPLSQVKTLNTQARIPHQILAEAVNPMLKQTLAFLSDFIEKAGPPPLIQEVVQKAAQK